LEDGEGSLEASWVEIEEGAGEMLDFPGCDEEEEG